MKAHTTYKIYPKAINEFINDNYELNNINFGNIKNNLIAVLEKLNINSTLDCKWNVNNLYFFDKINLNKNDNKLSDFDEYSSFKFSFIAKEDISNESYEKAIKNLESNFINKYQSRIDKKRQELKKEVELKAKKRDRFIYALSGVLLILLVTFIFLSKQ